MDQQTDGRAFDRARVSHHHEPYRGSSSCRSCGGGRFDRLHPAAPALSPDMAAAARIFAAELVDRAAAAERDPDPLA